MITGDVSVKAFDGILGGKLIDATVGSEGFSQLLQDILSPNAGKSVCGTVLEQQTEEEKSDTEEDFLYCISDVPIVLGMNLSNEPSEEVVGESSQENSINVDSTTDIPSEKSDSVGLLGIATDDTSISDGKVESTTGGLVGDDFTVDVEDVSTVMNEKAGFNTTRVEVENALKMQESNQISYDSKTTTSFIEEVSANQVDSMAADDTDKMAKLITAQDVDENIFRDNDQRNLESFSTKLAKKANQLVNIQGEDKADGFELDSNYEDGNDHSNLSGNRDFSLQNVYTGSGTLNESVKIVDFPDVNAEVAVVDENLSRIEESIIKLIETTKDGEIEVMKVKLQPKELGTVDVVLKMEEGKVAAKIVVESESLKHILDSKVQDLNDNLTKQNVCVERLQVDISNSGSRPNGGSNYQGNSHEKDVPTVIAQNSFIEEEEITTSVSGGVSILA